jgi:hypothetical protein
VILGRAGAEPLPNTIAERLRPRLEQIAERASEFLRASAGAITSRTNPPPLVRVQAALVAYLTEVDALRKEGLTQTLASSELEHLFALSFALQQLQQNLSDLARCIAEWARPQRSIFRLRQPGSAPATA